jgi:hypothetical protein
MSSPDAPPGYVYDGGWRATAGPDRTHPYTTIEAAARARDRGEFAPVEEVPIHWYPLPQRAQVSTCKRCQRRLVWVKIGEPPRALPLELARRAVYGGRGYAPVHPERCQPAERRRTYDDDEPTGRDARSVAFEDD